MDKIDCFGLNNKYKDNNSGSCSENLSSLVKSKGFNDYSKEGISSFLCFRYPVFENTLFNNFSKDYATSRVNNNSIEWKPNFTENNKITEETAINTSEKLLINAIKQLVGDKQRIGITLSGGLDSSLILAMVKKMYPKREIYTYSIGFYGENEFEYSRLAASLYSTKHSEQILDKEDFLSDNSIIDKLIAFKGAPLHPNELPLAMAEIKALEDNCDIVLCGEGADDIFGGYGRNLRMYLDYNPKEDYSDFLYSNYSYFSEDEIKEILNSKYYYSNINFFKRLFAEDECPKDLKNKMFYFIQRLHTKGLIERGNNALAFNGFCDGFPFINSELVEFANSIPFDLKVKWKHGFDEHKCREINYKDISENCDVTKYILKKVGERYLPTNIIYRPKYGFPVPFENWLKDLTDYPFDKDVFKITNIEHFSGWKKFMLINLDKFIKIFNDSKI